ncbi:tetratricopeptide (TPR) repeat protein [Actinoplanes lutulentus]|uniref:Tetratricopeptide repeat protein n=1 Tax=Actinoplanes lutulentus TaxID=1287878 RepID=A0A327Z6G2_9ACTN|nr:CHAT domain-containing tetratricopeptide repeat protein [Actinoplanes lutulentus]MBB2947831.1 tetratricopeptide (TPR) repeat protein [Actinoplanes lutulentus]RAK29856.1 tetratricopeptide repeat protein [Actinoplanes lutulentus]
MAESTILDAREALRLADSEPQRAASLGAAVLRTARAERNPEAAAVAERAIGLAAMHVADLDVALRHLRSAIRWAGRAGSALLAAEARMTLAFVLNRRGRSRAALREIDTALLDLTGVPHARAEAQRGAIMHQLGRFDDALASYRSSLPALRKGDDHLWTLRVLLNRGLLQGHRQDFAAAQADLDEAMDLSARLELKMFAAFVHQNLAEVHALRGDVPAALHHLGQAENLVPELNFKTGPLLADRSRLLLSVRLTAEAREAAEQAITAFEAEHRRSDIPEVRLVLARAAVLDGDTTTALTQARLAGREFARQGRRQWSTAARLMVLSCRAALGHPPAVRLNEVEQLIPALEAAGWPAVALEARLLAARLARERGHHDRSHRLLRPGAALRRRGTAVLRARGWYAEAQLRLLDDNRRGATAAVRAGLRILDEHRATLGATDLRAHASGHRLELVELGLHIAMDERRPDRVFRWAERGRASHLLLSPARPPEDPIVADAVAELRATAAQIRSGHLAGRNVTRLVQRQITLERWIRDYCRMQRQDVAADGIEPVGLPGLAGTLGDSALLEFLAHDGMLYVLAVSGGRCVLRAVAPVAAAGHLVDQVTFTLRRLSHPTARPASREAAARLLRAAATALDDMLLGPVAAELGDRALVVIPTGPLQSLPWSVLPSCAGRPVSVAPSATLWHRAATGPGPAGESHSIAPPAGDRDQALDNAGRHIRFAGDISAPTGRRVIVGYGLPGAVAEAESLAALHGTQPITGAEATVGAVTRAMNGASLAHIAAHGRVQPSNPLFSSLMLSDGPLTVYDMERLDRVPATVILAACDTGRTVVHAGDEVLGISATLLSRGARQIVASVVPVPDVQTRPMMIALHELLLTGVAVPNALAEIQKRVAGEDGTAAAAAAGFVCVGAAAPIA